MVSNTLGPVITFIPEKRTLPQVLLCPLSCQLFHLRLEPWIERSVRGFIDATDQRRADNHRMDVRGDQPYLFVRGHAESGQDLLFVGTDPLQE